MVQSYFAILLLCTLNAAKIKFPHEDKNILYCLISYCIVSDICRLSLQLLSTLLSSIDTHRHTQTAHLRAQTDIFAIFVLAHQQEICFCTSKPPSTIVWFSFSKTQWKKDLYEVCKAWVGLIIEQLYKKREYYSRKAVTGRHKKVWKRVKESSERKAKSR